MAEPGAQSLDELIQEITTWPAGMPVRAMERVLAQGEPAVAAVSAALERFRDDPERDRLWLVVLLGELRHPSAVASLIGEVRRGDDEFAAMAAAEALAKIGPPAIPALLEAAAASEPLLRIHAYAALGWIPEERSYAALLDALQRDLDLRDTVAMALSEQGRPEAIPALYEAYRTCQPWQRLEFEDVLGDLHWGRHRLPLWTRDWRLRYRRHPALGSFHPSWVWMAVLMERHKERKPERVAPPLKPLEEIVKEPPEPDEPPETCEECGGAIERAIGVAVCPQTAVGIAVHQLRFLADAREDGFEDLFDLLDELESEEWEHLERGEPVTPAGRGRWRDELDELRICRQTCEWLIGGGVEEIGPARARLFAEAERLADRYGDPEGLLAPVRRPAARVAKVGRNDPCPCGSGRKYKRCCLGREEKEGG